MLIQTLTEQNKIHHQVKVSPANFDQELALFSDRLRLIIKSESVRSYAKKIGISNGALRAYLAGTSEPSMRILFSLAKEGNVDPTWLATGEGEMYLKAQRDKSFHSAQLQAEFPVVNDSKPASIEQSEAVCDDTEDIIPATIDDFALVPVYDVQASAGHGSHVESELKTGHLAFRRDWLRDKGLKTKDLAIITAIGDSMEPTLSDGDIMLVDTSIDKIINDAIYIVQTDHHLIVKRIQQALDGSLTIISDNQRYERQKISPEQAKNVKIAGRVKWYGHEI